MTQNNSTFTVVTKDRNGALRRSIFVSRATLVVNAERVRYEGDVPADRSQVEERGVAVKVTISALQPGDFVVGSVCNGGRRSFEVLAGAVPAALVAQLPEFADIAENRFVVPADAVSEEGLVNTAGLTVREQFVAGVKQVENFGEPTLAELRERANDVVVLTNGPTVVEFPGAVRVN